MNKMKFLCQMGDCDICFIRFDENERIPKILECGHTFCKTCIEKFHDQRKCPNCNKVFSVRDINSYPTNYYLLKTINDYKDIETPSWNINNQIDKLKLSFLSVQDRLTEYVSTYNEVTEALSTLDSLNPKSDIVEIFQCLFNCKLTLASAESLLKLRENEFSAYIKLDDASSTTDFINKLVSQIKAGVPFFAVHQVEGELKFGKLCFEADWKVLFMYSLSSYKITKEDRLIWFSDLKKCFLKKKLLITFIKVPMVTTKNSNIQEKIIIRLNDTGLAAQFMKICSGETGALYKGANCINRISTYVSPILSVPEYVRNNGNNEHYPVDYGLDLTVPPLMYKKESIIVGGYTDGGFKIFKVKKDSFFSDIIGEVLDKNLIRILPNSKIIDSGIGYFLE